MVTAAGHWVQVLFARNSIFRRSISRPGCCRWVNEWIRECTGLTDRDRGNTGKTRLCIHDAPLGTHERCIGFLIEHHAGNFPFRLAPDQARVITLNDDVGL